MAVGAARGARAGLAGRARRALADALEHVTPYAERDEHGYVVRLEDNLLPGITRAQLEPAFGAGAGRELEGKMRAPWSSSALAVNSFAPWQDDVRQLLVAELSSFTEFVTFEARCPNGVSSIPPHLDVLLERGDEIVGVESKCTEYLTPTKKVAVSPRYLKLAERGDARAGSRWFAALAHVPEFRLLDAYQLVKHYLGLALQYRGRPLTIVYLYWEPAKGEANALFAEHRAEVERFGALIGDEPTCRFEALSYTEHWRELEALSDPPGWLSGHLTELRRRYLIEI